MHKKRGIDVRTFVSFAHQKKRCGADVVCNGAACDAHGSPKDVALSDVAADCTEPRNAKRTAGRSAPQRMHNAVRNCDADARASSRTQTARQTQRRGVDVARQTDQIAVLCVALVDACVCEQHAAPHRRKHARKHPDNFVAVVQHSLNKPGFKPRPGQKNTPT